MSAKQLSADIPVRDSNTKGGLENPPSGHRSRGEGDGQGAEGHSREDRCMTGWQTKTLGEVAQIERGKLRHRP